MCDVTEERGEIFTKVECSVELFHPLKNFDLIAMTRTSFAEFRVTSPRKKSPYHCEVEKNLHFENIIGKISVVETIELKFSENPI